MSWKLTRLGHFEWRVGPFLLVVDDAEMVPHEGEWWNWNIQNLKEGENIVVEERWELEAGGAQSEYEAKEACVAALRKIAREALDALDSQPLTMDVVSAHGAEWFPLYRIFVSPDRKVEGFLAAPCATTGRASMPAPVMYIEVKRA